MPPADYNVAPSTLQPVIRESKDEGNRELVMMRWGLIPFFTKQLSDVKGRHLAVGILVYGVVRLRTSKLRNRSGSVMEFIYMIPLPLSGASMIQ